MSDDSFLLRFVEACLSEPALWNRDNLPDADSGVLAASGRIAATLSSPEIDAEKVRPLFDYVRDVYEEIKTKGEVSELNWFGAMDAHLGTLTRTTCPNTEPEVDNTLNSTEEEDVPCDICRELYPEDDNEMVFCSSCSVCVHQACYGIETVPKEDWFCNPCSMKVQQPQCILCPNKGGAMKSTSSLKWAHVSCAWWIKEVRIGCIKRMEPIDGISLIPRRRWHLLCSLCKVRSGACIQCVKRSCATAFHVTCAFNNGLRMEMRDEDSTDRIKLLSYCRKHSSMEGTPKIPSKKMKPRRESSEFAISPENLPSQSSRSLLQRKNTSEAATLSDRDSDSSNLESDFELSSESSETNTSSTIPRNMTTELNETRKISDLTHQTSTASNSKSQEELTRKVEITHYLKKTIPNEELEDEFYSYKTCSSENSSSYAFSSETSPGRQISKLVSSDVVKSGISSDLQSTSKPFIAEKYYNQKSISVEFKLDSELPCGYQLSTGIKDKNVSSTGNKLLSDKSTTSGQNEPSMDDMDLPRKHYSAYKKYKKVSSKHFTDKFIESHIDRNETIIPSHQKQSQEKFFVPRPCEITNLQLDRDNMDPLKDTIDEDPVIENTKQCRKNPIKTVSTTKYIESFDGLSLNGNETCRVSQQESFVRPPHEKVNMQTDSDDMDPLQDTIDEHPVIENTKQCRKNPTNTTTKSIDCFDGLSFDGNETSRVSQQESFVPPHEKVNMDSDDTMDSLTEQQSGTKRKRSYSADISEDNSDSSSPECIQKKQISKTDTEEKEDYAQFAKVIVSTLQTVPLERVEKLKGEIIELCLKTLKR